MGDVTATAQSQSIKDVPSPEPNPVALQNLPLGPVQRSELQAAIRTRDYKRAENLLLEQVKQNPKSSQLLTLLGGIFFQDGQYLNAAIALKKAEAISPLDDTTRFTLAMAYVVLNHRDWARPELERLTQTNPMNALYVYWLSRLDYDAQQYRATVQKLETVLKLDHEFVRAHDSLGLCYEGLGKQQEAIRSYVEAVQSQSPQRPEVTLALFESWDFAAEVRKLRGS